MRLETTSAFRHFPSSIQSVFRNLLLWQIRASAGLTDPIAAVHVTAMQTFMHKPVQSVFVRALARVKAYQSIRVMSALHRILPILLVLALLVIF